MKATIRWLISNLGLLLLSLALALLVWTAAVRQDNPTVEDRFPSRIPVTLLGLPENMTAYGDTDAQVYVTLQAPESVWQALQREDIRATVDLSELEEGIHQLPIHVALSKEPIRVVRIEPETITIHMEPIEQADIAVSIRLEGDTALGYVARAPVVDPMTVTVQGPASYVAQVEDIVAQVSIEGERAAMEGEYPLEPRDAEGAPVSYVELSPAQVVVQVPIEQLRGFRDLAVTAPLSGTVASGYRIANITVDPPLVTVFGRQDAIERVPGYLETTPLNIQGAREDVEVQLPLVLPEGVSLIGTDNPLITVRVLVVAQEGSLTVEQEVEIQRLSEGITATVAPTMVQVILSGPVPVLEQLREEDIRVIVDLFGLSQGSHSIEPQVVGVPTGVTREAILPATVQVEIVVLGTPTPVRR